MTTKWTTIKVPIELKELIKKIAEKQEVPEWKVIMRAVSFYQEQLKKPSLKESLPWIEKAAWYAAKVAMSVGMFKENPTEESLRGLFKVLDQVEERYKVDTSLLREMARQYFYTKNKKDRIELNAACKLVVLDILLSFLGDRNLSAAKE